MLSSFEAKYGCPSSLSARKGKQLAVSAIIPIVYVFTSNPILNCKHFNTHDHYIRFSVEQALRTNRGPQHPVILASNFKDCNHSLATIRQHWHKDIVTVDYTEFMSASTKEFVTYTDQLFMQSYMPELWAAAALRFFVLADMMSHYKYEAVLHVEGDNTLYGETKDLIQTLWQHYPGMAATPLTKTLDFVTASVLWIGNQRSIVAFNEFLLRLGKRNGTMFNAGPNTPRQDSGRWNSRLCARPMELKRAFAEGNMLDVHHKYCIDKFTRSGTDYTSRAAQGLSDWEGFIHWLRPFACCAPGGGGVAADKNGNNGLKPFAVNEMAMLGYYSYLATELQCPNELQFLAVVPSAVLAVARALHMELVYPEVRFASSSSSSSSSSLTSLSSKAISATSFTVSTSTSSNTSTSSSPINHNLIPGLPQLSFSPSGTPLQPLVGADALGGIFDPNSWGQFLGGTHKKRGKDKMFSDKTHIAFEVIWYYKCRPVMRCSKTRLSVAQAFNQTVIALAPPTTPTSQSQSFVATTTTTTGGTSDGVSSAVAGGGVMTEYRDTVCVTAPFVQCWNASLSGYTPLWNLHVHSKQTRLYQSTPCHCDSAV